MPVRKPNRVTSPKWAVLNGTKTSRASMPRARGRWRLDRTRNRGSAPESEARTPTQETTTITQLEDAVNSDERDYDAEAASQPLMAGEYGGEGPSGDHLPDCEMFTDYDGSPGCSCGGFPCESGFSIGPARDPYGVSCEYIQRDHPARGGHRIHRGINPLPGPGPEPQYLEWAGGGYCAGDPLPVRDVVHLAADGEPATGRCEVSSWQGKSQRPYGPGGYNRCTRSSGDHREHLDEWGNRFIVNPDAAGGQHDPRFRRLA